MRRANFTLDRELRERVEPLAAKMQGMTPTKFVDACVRAILTMLEEPPEERRVPAIVVLLDAALKDRPRVISSIGLNESPPPYGTKKRA